MQVKGSAVVTIPLFLKENHGEEAFQQWISCLSTEAQDVYKYPILPTSWYPVKEIMVEPVQKICEQFYGGNLNGAWDSGRFSANHGLKGVYKVFIRFGSVQFLIKKASTILPTYYDTCSIDVVDFDEANKSTVMHITNFPDPDEIIEHRIGGWVERALEISGCKDVKVDISKSLAKGDPVTEYKIAWM